MSSKFHSSKWKRYFSQIIDRYLKIEEVKYLIHYVKFKIDQPYFMQIPSVFPTFLNFDVRLYIISPNLHRN